MMRRTAAPRLHIWGTVLAVVALLGAQAVPAAAVTTTSGDPGGTAHTRESVRAMTWNMCGDAGGRIASDAGYCPWRNGDTKDDGKTFDGPATKMAGVAKVVDDRNLNVVMLQEVCAGKTPGDTLGVSHLDLLAGKLGDEWTFASAGMTRPDEPYAEPERSGVEMIDQEGSDCRGPALTGTLGVAIAVKGKITWKTETDFETPLGLTMGRGTVLCVEVEGWESHVCTTHVANFGSGDTFDGYYKDQIDTVAGVVKKFPSVVLGGDFNTRDQNKLQPLYSLMSECDQRAYTPDGTDAVNEPTKITRSNVVTDANGGIVSHGYETSKIDYLFSTDAFTGCDSWTQLGDRTDYRVTVQPTCTSTTPATNWSPCDPEPTAYSDHTPLYGYTQGGAKLAWKLDGGPEATSGGSGGHTGALTGGGAWTAEHDGALELNGSDGAVTTTGPVVSTSRSFSVSAWAKVDPGAGTSVVLSQDGTTISGMMLWYGQDGTWRFGLPKADSSTWAVDQAVAPATAGVWTRLTGVYDAVTGAVALYVDGQKKATATHTSRWDANGPFVVGRDKVNGVNNAYFDGFVQGVEVFDHALRDDQVASHATRLTAPTDKSTPLQGEAGDSFSQGCHLPLDFFGADFGTATGLTPTLTATVDHPDPSREVWAEFALKDSTTGTQQIVLGGPGSASARVRGGGAVSVTTPPLVPGHSYAWQVRTTDGTAVSPLSATCNFRTR
jgi:endonuclease/exonuclease/phosphatase family metal-dependent hydrolase|uniref:LamG-like jellyroll fold domain-containing protein n=1 Tax=Streptomyces sp. MSC1_001 TaxID=2909263 RepID=UPI00202E2819|nr:LamG-like jellyroll fold domain-containing protein [Streptomyces sp. MSC1_001]